MQAVKYAEIGPSDVSDDQIARHAELFSGHYGTWAANACGMKVGAPGRISATRLRLDHLFDAHCRLIAATVTAPDGQEVAVGHALVHRFDIPEKGQVSWVSQLVVHTAYRKRGIAKKLCRMAWAVDRFYAAGLVSSNPFAVRALERATERACDRDTTMSAAPEMLEHCGIPYVRDSTLCFEDGRCLIDTNFFVDHAEPNRILSGLSDWKLGALEDGKEFVAFTFAVSPKVSPPKR